MFFFSRMSRLNYAFAQNPKVFWCPDEDRMEWLSSFHAYDLDILSLELGKKCWLVGLFIEGGHSHDTIQSFIMDFLRRVVHVRSRPEGPGGTVASILDPIRHVCTQI